MSAQYGARRGVRKCHVRAVLPVDVVAEARRLDRPVTWVMRLAWRLALPGIRKIPARRP